MHYLFGFPGAGAGPRVFPEWQSRLGKEITFQQITYNPVLKKGNSYCSDMKEAARQSAATILSLVRKEDDISFFGHCMGAAVAYETAVLLAKDHDIHLKFLFISAFTSPDVPIEDGISDWDDSKFAEEIHSHGTFPEEFFVNPSILKLFLPRIRADYRMIEAYHDTEHIRLMCPIIGFFGKDDETVTPDNSAGWRDYTTQTFARRYYPGNHYFYYDYQDEIIDVIRSHILVGSSADENMHAVQEENMEQKIREILAEITEGKYRPEDFNPDTDLINDIGLDSLQLVRFLMKTEESLDVVIDYDRIEFEDLTSIRSFMDFLKRSTDAKPDMTSSQ